MYAPIHAWGIFKEDFNDFSVHVSVWERMCDIQNSWVCPLGQTEFFNELILIQNLQQGILKNLYVRLQF